MALDYKEKLENHIEALETTYDNLVLILNEPIQKNDEGNLKLKDSEKKIYGEGISKIVETADAIIGMIRDKTLELEKIKKDGENDKKIKEINVIEEPEEIQITSSSHLGRRIR